MSEGKDDGAVVEISDKITIAYYTKGKGIRVEISRDRIFARYYWKGEGRKMPYTFVYAKPIEERIPSTADVLSLLGEYAEALEKSSEIEDKMASVLLKAVREILSKRDFEVVEK